MKINRKWHIPVMSLLIFILTLIILNITIFRQISFVKNQIGSYIYPLDDAYIHLSIAKNLVNEGVWGITKHHFSSTSSSPLFTILLALAIRIFGNNDLIPLSINIFIGNLLILAIYLYFRKFPAKLFIANTGLIFGSLIDIQILSGMEHILHIFLIVICWLSLINIVTLKREHIQDWLMFYLTIPLLCITRYESLFFVFPISIYLVLQKKIKTAIITVSLSLTPIFLFGIFSMYQGGHFFPNSVLAKGRTTFSVYEICVDLFEALKIVCFSSRFYLYFILIILTLFISKWSRIEENWFSKFKKVIRIDSVYFVVLINLFAHLMFAATGWLYRYDAYLIGLLVITIALAYDSTQIKFESYSTIMLIPICLFLIYSLSIRYIESKTTMKYASKNIHDQQIQSARFLKKYFQNKVIMANDIGAISYFADIKLIDMVGLGSTDILDIKLNNPTQYDEYINTRNYDLMLIYDSWFKTNKFKKRKKIAELKICDNYICGDSKTTIYVPENKEKIEYAIRSLENFRSELPKDVMIEIYY